MKILVVGGAGYIGSICTEQLLDKGHTVSIFDNLSEGHRSAVDQRARFVEGDLQDRQKITSAIAAEKPDAVMHFAASALVGESMQNPSKYFRNNIGNGVNLLDAMMAADVKRLVFSSTCATFGPPERVPIDEMQAQRPINPYGESKLAFEKILRWYDEIHGLKFVSLRYFNAAGASENFGEDHRVETHLIPNVLKVALGQKSQCEIFGTNYPTPDGTCIRDYIHIVDLAQAHILALAPGRAGFFNLGNGSGYSVREVIQTCERISGQPIKAVEQPRRPGDPPRLVAAAGKALAELDWQPKFPKLEDIVATAWDWHRRHPQGYRD